MKSPNENDHLTGLLRSWRVEPSRSAGFSTGVWRKIEARRAADSWAGLVYAHPAALALLFLFATLAGGWSGAEFARIRVQTQSAAMADAYVQSLDARQMANR